jgi:uncharacterized membrane protein YkvA (DUF1232 family)
MGHGFVDDVLLIPAVMAGTVRTYEIHEDVFVSQGDAYLSG